MATVAVPIERKNYLNAEYGIRSWLFTTDHKRIALLYLVSITAMFFVGGFFALLIRLELLTPAGDLLLVALKMPPSRTGTYSNVTPVRCSIAGIASWLRNALGLPKSNMNCGLALTAVSPGIFRRHCGAAGAARPPVL